MVIVSVGNCSEKTSCKAFSFPQAFCEYLKIHLNPIQDIINFNYPKDNYTIKFFASNGGLLISKTGNITGQQINVAHIASGMYILQIG